jgi:transposase
MRQDHRAGEKLFVDYAGQTKSRSLIARTGEIKPAQIFVAVLGAFSYTCKNPGPVQGYRRNLIYASC